MAEITERQLLLASLNIGGVPSSNGDIFNTIGADGTPNGGWNAFTDADLDHPIFHVLPFTSGNVNLGLDAYYNGINWKSSNLGSNFILSKNANVLSFNRNNNIPVGTTLGALIPFLSADLTTGLVSLATGTGINKFSTDVTLSGNSDDTCVTEKAIKTYVDNHPVTGIWELAGGIISKVNDSDKLLLNYATSGSLTAFPAYAKTVYRGNTTDPNNSATNAWFTTDDNTYPAMTMSAYKDDEQYIGFGVYFDSAFNWKSSNANSNFILNRGQLALEILAKGSVAKGSTITGWNTAFSVATGGGTARGNNTVYLKEEKITGTMPAAGVEAAYPTTVNVTVASVLSVGVKVVGADGYGYVHARHNTPATTSEFTYRIRNTDGYLMLYSGIGQTNIASQSFEAIIVYEA